MCIRIVSIQNGCVTCHLFCWLLVNVYKYAIKHFSSVFFSLYRIFDIVQYSVDAVYIAGALFEKQTGSRCGSGVSSDIVLQGFELSQAGAIGRKWYLEREFESCERRRAGSLLRLCPTAGTIPPLAHFRGALPLRRVPETASWAISCFCGCCRKGAQGGEQLERGGGSRDRRMLAEKTMLSWVTSWVPTLDWMVLSWRSQPWEKRDREEPSCLRIIKLLRNPLWKKLPTWVSCEAGPELTQTRKGAVKGWGDSSHCKPSGSKSHRVLLPVGQSQSWLRWREKTH